MVRSSCYTLYRVTNTSCRIGTEFSRDDGHIVTRNMYRKAINILRKFMHQVGSIYKRLEVRVYCSALLKSEFVDFKAALYNVISLPTLQHMKTCSVRPPVGFHFCSVRAENPLRWRSGSHGSVVVTCR